MKKLFMRTLAIFIAALITLSAGIAAGAYIPMTLEEFEEESRKVGETLHPFLEAKIFPRKSQEMIDKTAAKYPRIQSCYDVWWDTFANEDYDTAIYYLKEHYTEFLKAYAYELTIYVPCSVWKAVSNDTSPSFMVRQFMSFLHSLVLRIYLLPIRGFSKPLFID